MRLFTCLGLAAACLFSQPIVAQKFTLRGIVLDSAEGKPLEFATLILFSEKTDTAGKTSATASKSAFSNSNGKFKFENLPAGDYHVEASQLGFQKFISPKIALAADMDLPEIRLAPAGKTLGQVTVIAAKPLLESKADRIIYNADADPTNAGATGLELLKKVPFLTVDADDNITLKGSSSFKVQHNGRSTGFLAKNPKEALKAFPASLIKRVEVITTPGARYEAEGTAGIINIVTQAKIVGITGNASTSLNTLGQQNHSLSLNAKLGKWGFSSWAGAGLNGVQNTRNAFERTNNFPTTIARDVREGSGTGENAWFYGNVELAYDLDSLQSLSFYYDGNGGKWQGKSTTQYSGYNAGKELVELGTFTNDNTNEWPGANFGLDYIKHFKRPEQEFSVSLALNKDFGKNTSFSSRTFLKGNQPERYTRLVNDQPEDETTAEINYTHPLDSTQTLSFGGKGIFRRIDNSYTAETADSTFVFKPDLSNTGIFEYQQDVLSGYAEYGLNLGKLSLKPGFRYEHTQLHGGIVNQSGFDNSYPAYIPTFSASYKLDGSHSLRLGYSRRIQRPSLWYLKPQTNNTDPRNISTGNPYLLPEFTHQIELGYDIFAGENSIGLTLEQGFTRDAINNFQVVDPSTGITTNTYRNLGSNNQTNLRLHGSAKLFKKLTLSSHLSLGYAFLQGFSGAEEYRNEGITGNGYLNLQWDFGDGWRVQGNGWLGLGRIQLQGRSTPYGSYQLGFSKSFLNSKALRFALLADQFLTADRVWEFHLKDPQFEILSKNWNPVRAIRFSLSYRFGKLRENVSRKKGVSNDDQKKGEN